MRKLALVLACTFLCLAGCASEQPSNPVKSSIENNAGDSNSSAAADTPAPTESPAPAAEILSLGKKATLGDWKICAKKAEVKNKIMTSKYLYVKPQKGNTIVIVTLSAKNNGDKAETLLPKVGMQNTMITAILSSKDGEEYKPSDLMGYDKDLIGDTIKAGASKTGVIAFQVPKKAAKNKRDLTLKIGTVAESITYTLK